jgi:DNA-binding NtrC family response regulator
MDLNLSAPEGLQTDTSARIRAMLTASKTDNIIIFSESVANRDFLRNRIAKFGYNAVCFEKEEICFDNFRAISPRFVIVQTEADQIVWRFIFAAHALRWGCPLLVVSESLISGAHLEDNVGLSFEPAPAHIKNDSIMQKFEEIFDQAHVLHMDTNLPLFVGETNAIRKIRSQLSSIALSCDPVLITGESGTGKELLARLIDRMAKDERNLVKIDCRELQPEMLINGWLDAVLSTGDDPRPATLFFDNIHLVPKEIQSEILLVIDQVDIRQARPEDTIARGARVIAAGEPVIQERLKGDGFRKDLFYRLNVIPIQIPPLRDRKDDISMLMDYFVIKASADSQKSIMIPSRKARDVLFLHRWPGNVEELNTYMRRVVAAGNESCIFNNWHIPKLRENTQEYLLKSAAAEDLPKPHEIKSFLPGIHDMSLKRVCEEFVGRTEKKLMKKALESTNWNRKKAAKLLKISYKSMLNKIKVYDII